MDRLGTILDGNAPTSSLPHVRTTANRYSQRDAPSCCANVASLCLCTKRQPDRGTKTELRNRACANVQRRGISVARLPRTSQRARILALTRVGSYYASPQSYDT